MKAVDLQGAVLAQLQREFAQLTIYQDTLPQDPVRPSLLLETISFDRKDVNFSLVEESQKLRITFHSDPSAAQGENTQVQMLDRVLGLFSTGQLGLGDRFVRCEAQSALENGQHQMCLWCTWWEDRPTNQPEFETMAELGLKLDKTE